MFVYELSLFNIFSVDVQPELNPQTTTFCEKLGIDDPLFLALSYAGRDMSKMTLNCSATTEHNVLVNESVNKETEPEIAKRAPLASFLPKPKWTNDEEINLEESDDEVTPIESKEADNSKSSSNIKEKVEEIKAAETNSILDLSVEDKSSILTSDLIEKPTDITSPPVKKFKRRNESIYAKEEDE